MIRFIRNLYLTNTFFIGLGIITGLFAFGFAVPVLFPIAKAALTLFIILTLADIVLTFNPNFLVECERKLPKMFSLGDENRVELIIDSSFGIPLKLQIIDELPVQFQERNFSQTIKLKPMEKRKLSYKLRPVERGEYHFNNVNLYSSSPIGLIQRRHNKKLGQMVPVYPSIIQMKKYGLIALSKVSSFQGVKKLRRLGHSYEFEQIKNYVKGDDYRSVNWKATSRRNNLMVNQYEDQRAQQVYTIIDKSRSMHMPFEGMSLFDYSVNACLAISNVSLLKHDKAGLITFSNKVGASIKADRSQNQLRKIINTLYNEKARNLECNYELLYQSTRNIIKGRSLVFLYTNFESTFALERVLPILRKINAFHLLVVVIFENTEIKEFSAEKATDLEGIYHQTLAQQYISDKQQMVQKLKQHKIQTVLTNPADLTVNTINKYLEMKSRGLI